MLIKQLIGSNAGMITEAEPDVAQERVASGSYELLPESAWDDPEIVALIGKVPSAKSGGQSVFVTTNGPDGYKIEPIFEGGGTGWYVRNRTGKALNYLPLPNRVAAIGLAERHLAGPAAVRAEIEGKAESDRVSIEAFQKEDDARRATLARANGGR